MTEKELLEKQAADLKSAREQTAKRLSGNIAPADFCQINASLMAICEQERAVAHIQVQRGYIK